MPFDLDCNDSDFRAHLSEEQLARLERRQCPPSRPLRPPTSLAAAVERLSSGIGRGPMGPAATDGAAYGDAGATTAEHAGTASKVTCLPAGEWFD